MKKRELCFILPIVIASFVCACSNQSPQEKAADRMEKAPNKVMEASEDALATSENATAKNTDAIIYSNLAATNEVISKMPAPQLSNNEAKSLYTKLGKAVVDHINLKTAKEVRDEENAMKEIEKESKGKRQAGKITQTDYDNILNIQRTAML